MDKPLPVGRPCASSLGWQRFGWRIPDGDDVNVFRDIRVVEVIDHSTPVSIADGSQPSRQITQHGHESWGWTKRPAPSLDLNKRCHWVGPSSNSYFQIFRLPVTGGTPEQITFDPSDKTQPSYSPSGDRIVFTVFSYESQFWVLAP